MAACVADCLTLLRVRLSRVCVISARMLPAAGWSLQDVRSKCVSEVGAKPSYWVSFATACV